MPAAQAFTDTLPNAPADAAADAGERDANRRRRRRGGRGRGRDEGGNADGVGAVIDAPQGSEQAVDSAPVAAESVLTEPVSHAAEFLPGEARAHEEVAVVSAPIVVAAPRVAASPIAASPVAPAAPVAAPATITEPYNLPTDTLAAIASQAGLQWVNSDAEKIRAVQEAMANEPQPMHAPRQPKPRAVLDDGPLVLVETKKDLAQIRLPFDGSAPPAAP